MQTGGIVLCGGRGERMGRPKELLPFAGEAMLARVVRLVGGVVDPVVVVASPSGELPPLPSGVRLVRDDEAYRGPLAGMRQGLSALAEDCEAAFVTGCDVPLLRAEFIRAMIERLEENEAAVPREGERVHPLEGVYRTSLVARIDGLLAAGERRAQAVVAASRTAHVDVEKLRGVDPQLWSLYNVNTPEEYAAAIAAEEEMRSGEVEG